ncbi:MAG: hypothetical protein ACR2PI_27110 [Hyphomicrobiaceae bacterium]
MFFMNEVELATRLQHSSNIDELMDCLNDCPHKTATASQFSSSTRPDARITQAKELEPRSDRRQTAKPPYPRAA